MTQFTPLRLVAVLVCFTTITFANDWPTWRGVKRDGLSTETGLLKQWPEGGPKLLWKSKGLGNGMASVAVQGDRIYTMGSLGNNSTLIGLKRDDGTVLWSTPIGPGGKPNGTPTVDPETGLVYGMSKSGDFICVEGATGKEVWKKNFGKDYGGRMMSGWGYSESPLIDGDRLLCTPGGPEAMIVALNKKNGEVIWKTSAPDLGNKGKNGAGYSSIVISQAAETKQYVQLTGRGVISVAADDGRLLWNYGKVANGTANIPTPLIKGDHVFCSSGYGDGGSALLKILKKEDGTFEATEVYYYGANKLQNHHGGVILLGDYIYGGHGHNQGMPFCMHMLTGEIKWLQKSNDISKGKSAAVVYADGHLVFRYESGLVKLIEATPEEYREKGSFSIQNRGPSWPHPVIAGGRLYLRNADELLVYAVK
jgi:outer membrane protein assembly factor BamB